MNSVFRDDTWLAYIRPVVCIPKRADTLRVSPPVAFRAGSAPTRGVSQFCTVAAAQRCVLRPFRSRISQQNHRSPVGRHQEPLTPGHAVCRCQQ